MALPYGIQLGAGITINAGIGLGAAISPPPTPSPYEGSGVFNGAYLDVTETAGLSFGSGDFTIEAWIYPTGAGSNRRFFSQTINANPITQQCLRQTNTNKLQYFFNDQGNGLINITGSTNLNFNAWNHCAIVRSGATFTLYQNGVSVASGSYGGSLPDMITAGLVLGISNAGGTENWAGNISNYRIVKGVAVYTGSYTLPTASFTPTQSANPYGGSNTSAISAGQTQLLLNTYTNEAVNTDNSGYGVTVTDYGVSNDTLNPFTSPSGVDNVTGYTEMPPPVTPGGDLEDQTATVNGSVGFTINTPSNIFPSLGGTGVAISALTANNQAFFATYGTGTKTVTWGAGSTYGSSTVNVTTNSGSTIVFFINPALSYPATFNYPFTFN